MEIYVKLGGAATGAAARAAQDPDEEVRNFAAVMLGTLRDTRAVEPLIAALARRGHQRAPRGRREPRPDRLGGRGAAADRGAAHRALAAVPGDRRARRDRRPARRPTLLLPLLDDEMLHGPVLEALGRVAGRDALPHLVPHLYADDPALRNLAIQAVVAIEQRATAGGESLDPELQAALRKGDLVEHLLATLRDDDPQNRRTAVITLGWLKETRAEPALVGLLAETGLQEYVTHALVSIGCRDREAYAAGLAHPERRDPPGHAALPGLDRPGGRHGAGRAADPRPVAGGARRGRCSRSAGSATRTRRCCSSSCSATRARSSRRARWTRSRG